MFVFPKLVVLILVIAAVWHAGGLVMVIMLAGLRGIDEDIWKAARIDGLPPWRVYLSIVIPMLGASFATASVLLASGKVDYPAARALAEQELASQRAATL